MSYTKKNLDRVEDSAPKFGYQELQEARFAGQDLDAEATGVAFIRVKPGRRQGFAHKHDEAEEVYVVISGSGRIKLDDEIVELATWDAVRIPPATRRGLEAGPDGAEVLAVGAPNVGFGDAEQLPDFWPE